MTIDTRAASLAANASGATDVSVSNIAARCALNRPFPWIFAHPRVNAAAVPSVRTIDHIMRREMGRAPNRGPACPRAREQYLARDGRRREPAR